MKLSKRVLEQATRWYILLNGADFSEHEQIKFFQWLELDEAHQLAFIKIEQAWQSGDLITEVEDKPRPSLAEWQWAGIAAGFILAVAALFSVSILKDNKTIDEQYFASSIEKRTKVVLPDGTKATLRNHSRISYSESINSRSLILHEGEVFLDVMSRSDQPLFVSNSKGWGVKVLGTQFSVQNIDGDLSVTVLEGRVGIVSSPHKDDGKGPTAVVTSNQRTTVSRALRGGKPEPVNAVLETVWKGGMVTLDDFPLYDVVDAMNSAFPERIVLKQKELRNKRITGIITMGNIHKVVETIALLTNANIDYLENGVIELSLIK